jgi:hypothetical protein
MGVAKQLVILFSDLPLQIPLLFTNAKIANELIFRSFRDYNFTSSQQ